MNKDFYKKAGFVFIGIIIVLITARYTVLTTGRPLSRSQVAVRSERVIDWQDAGRSIGEYATVKGEIVRTYNSGRACFLNFHPDYRRHFNAIIFSSDFDKFPSSPENYYRNKKVEITGEIGEYRGAPQIILNSPSQIEIIEN
jgi:micrococcal nuclease